MLKRIALGGLAMVGLFVAGVLAFNWSGFAAPHGDGRIKLLSHRGVHQTFDHAGVENDTCTATRILPPTHDFIENTLPSMAAAFDAGADVVELDVHLTPDKEFAVIHDWTLDCRTDGKGVTQDTPMPVIRTLDAGYGYTADGGKTFPLRGEGVGLIPTLPEVFAHFPHKSFLINFKSRRAEEGEALGALIAAHPEWRDNVWASYGGAEPTFASLHDIEGLRGYSPKSAMGCLVDYELSGWTSLVPKSCRNTIVVAPSNFTWAIWGWPHAFTRRLEKVGSSVILLGPYEKGDNGTGGIDSLEQLRAVPDRFAGYVWTNRIELIGPALRTQGR